ncbi:uncharacterized protein BDCG_07522 [Blastomyces dermatitidis ER-3]|uniref:Uncharacterized protein n=1 Tax=Ajellomyces dermatitidis (strain ER-3 / ATCC MYA-2586) TaxID=559297 RepID=A0ABP2F5Q7_AJEDR|nr:uncharacterized protein BDCG_07522 [Blastomyces dermatitidis ER-3]EEQ92402.1 hypothetical protein BDCG_07522 [Blastomyces dermatitidis ER-3]
MLGTYITNLMILPIALLITIPLAFIATITITIAFTTLCLRLCLVYLDFFAALARAYVHTLPASNSTTTTAIYPRNPLLHTIYNNPIRRRSRFQPGTQLPAENQVSPGNIYRRSPYLLLRRSSTPPERVRRLRRQSSHGSLTQISRLSRKYSLPTPGSLSSFVGEPNLSGNFDPIDGPFQIPAGSASSSQISSASSDKAGDDEHDDRDDEHDAAAEILNY